MQCVHFFCGVLWPNYASQRESKNKTLGHFDRWPDSWWCSTFRRRFSQRFFRGVPGKYGDAWRQPTSSYILVTHRNPHWGLEMLINLHDCMNLLLGPGSNLIWNHEPNHKKKGEYTDKGAGVLPQGLDQGNRDLFWKVKTCWNFWNCKVMVLFDGKTSNSRTHQCC